jgi:homoserine kinase type II
LKQLSQYTLSFKIPQSLPSKTGAPHVLLSSGAEACVFRLIPGKLPKTTSPKEIGRASGELNSALEKIKLDDVTGCAPPYYELYKVHHIVTRDLFFREIASSIYNCCRESADFLVQEIRSLEERLSKLQVSPIPIRRQCCPR